MSNSAWKLAEAVRSAAKKSEVAQIQIDPGASRYRVVTHVRVVAKVPKGFQAQPMATVRGFLDSKAALASSTKALMETLASKWAPYRLPVGYLYKPLAAFQLKAIGDMASAAGRPIDLKRANTLSKIRLALRAKATSDDATRTFTATVAIADDHVVVGQARFPICIDKNGRRRVRVGNCHLSLVGLQTLLAGANNFPPTK